MIASLQSTCSVGKALGRQKWMKTWLKMAHFTEETSDKPVKTLSSNAESAEPVMI